MLPDRPEPEPNPSHPNPNPAVAAGGTERVHLKDAKQSSSENIGARRTNSLAEVVETGAARSQAWMDEDDDLGTVNSNRPFIYRLTEQLWTDDDQRLADENVAREG